MKNIFENVLSNESFKLRLTKYEQYIIQHDISLFIPDNPTDFFNKIFIHYHSDFSPEWDEISKSRRISADQKLITTVKIQAKTARILEKIISDLIHKKKNEELKKEEKDKLEEAIQLETDNVKKYAIRYFHLLLEKYANMQPYERERIYFKEKFETIKNAKESEKQVQITTDGRDFQCSIYDIMVESGNTYIICKSAEKKDGELQKWKYGSFRFLYITNVYEVEENKSLYIDKVDETEIEDKIFYNGIQFFLDDVELIKVKFSDEGIKKYNSIRNVRPTEYYGWEIKDKSKKEEFNLKKKRDDINNIKTFKCTKKQMEFYLFQFGGDAEILEPIDLREEFLEKYKKAVEVYSKPLKID